MADLDDLKMLRPDHLPPTGGLEDAMRRGRRYRTRRTTGVVLAAATAAVLTGVTTIGSGSSSGTSTVHVVPATPTSSAVESGPSVSGVTVSWIPTSYRAIGDVGVETDASFAASGISGGRETPGPATFSLRFSPSAEVDAPLLLVGVQRGVAADLSKLPATLKTEWLQIHGQRALLRQQYSIDSSGHATPNAWLLEWVERGNVTLSVKAAHGATAADAVRMANGLILGAATSPTDPLQATVAVRRVVQQAFTGMAGLDTALAAVVEGQQLHSSMDSVIRQVPGAWASASARPGDVTFLDANTAQVNTTISYQLHGSAVMNHVGIEVVLRDGSWMVTQASFCDVTMCTPNE